MRPTLILAGLFLALAPVAARAGVVVVQAGGAFATVQAAVDAAADGDTILVKGTWNGANELVLMGAKSLSLVADAGANVTLAGIAIENLGAGKSVLLRGLRLTGFPLSDEAGALELFQNDGRIRVEACAISGMGGSAGSTSPFATPKPGQSAVTVSFCSDVALHGCTLKGGQGATIFDEDFQLGASSGADAVTLRASLVTLHGGTVSGGHGGNALDGGGSGGFGGDAILNKTATLHVEDSVLTGGNAGAADCDISGCGFNGSPGHGLASWFAAASSTIRDVTANGGLSVGGVPLPGIDISAGTLQTFPAEANRFTATSPVREGDDLTLTFAGPPDDALFLWLAFGPGALIKPAYQGLFLLEPPFVLVHLPVGALSGAGSLVLDLPIPELGPGIDVATGYLQLVASRDGQALLGPWATTTLLDASF